MTDSEIVMDIVSKVTGISKKKMLSKLRQWPVVEARMLYMLFCSRKGYTDQQIAWALSRNRTTVLKSRVKAEDYLKVSRVFAEKYNKIKEKYAAR